MGSVGACRQCAVTQYKDEQDDTGRIVMACMTPAKDGTRIGISDARSSDFRASVIEWLMVNHPHDCPVCEEGGECHLQDMTVVTGHVYRRYRFKKRTFRNQYLGPFLNHEMNRCITCYRCVRFYQDYAGGHDLVALASKNHVYFGRREDGVLENEFSGNLAEVCPTGVFTDKTLAERYTRKWDLQSSPSICTHCGLGCNTSPNERYGELRRIVNRYNHAVNGYFICDRGRFGYEFVNSSARLRNPIVRYPQAGSGPCTRQAAIARARELLTGRTTLGIGSPRASLESNFALRRWVGADNFYLGLAAQEQRLLARILQVLREGGVPAASMAEAERADAVLILGEDLPNTAPRLALALRQAVRQAQFAHAHGLRIPRWQDATIRDAARDLKSPLFVVSLDATRLDDVAQRTLSASPDDIARLGFAVAHALDPAAPRVPQAPHALDTLAQSIAQALGAAQRPLIIAGTSTGNDAVIQAAANVAMALQTKGIGGTRLAYTVPEANSLGLAMMGEAALDAAVARAQAEAVNIVTIENDLYPRLPQRDVQRLFDAAAGIVALDCLHSDTTAGADLVLPAGSFAESDGTFVNNEGRAQRFFQTFAPRDDIQESWRWVRDIAGGAHKDMGDWHSLDQVLEAMAAALPVFAPALAAAPRAGFRIAGQRIPREPHRYSGRTAMHADISVHEPKRPTDVDSPLSFSMEGYHGEPPAPLVPFFWAPNWNSNEAVNKFQQEIAGPLRGGPAGVRLIEPAGATRLPYYAEIPAAFRARAQRWLAVPLYHIFGSEPLSALSPAIAARAPAPYIALRPDDAQTLGVREGEAVTVRVNGSAHHLPLALHAALPHGIAGLPVGLHDLTDLQLPTFVELARGVS